MKFKYPSVIPLAVIVPIILLILLIVLQRRNSRDSYKKGVRVANSSLVMRLPEFQAAVRKKKITTVLIVGFLIMSIVSTFLLMARPYKTEVETVGVRKRDIILCMDTAFYLDDLNDQLIDAIEEVIRELDGDRIGVSLYNSSSFMLVPLTDDYDYAIEMLEDFRELLNLGIKLDQYYGKYYYEHDKTFSPEMQAEYDKDKAREEELVWMEQAARVNRQKGAFLTGDGLASCLYSFPRLEEEERSRVIILSTCNSEDVNGNPAVNLEEACDLCAEHNVTVYGLFRGKAAFDEEAEPTGFFLRNVEGDKGYEEAGQNMLECVEKTGGKMYEYGIDMTPEQIVKDITSQEPMQVRSIVMERAVGQPELFMILLLIGLLGMCVTSIIMYI